MWIGLQSRSGFKYEHGGTNVEIRISLGLYRDLVYSTFTIF